MANSEAKVFHSGDVVSCQSEPSWQDFVSMGVTRGNASVRTVPTFDLEAELMDALHGPIVGIDEAGRGPWAGPVVVAAVILNPDRIPEGLNDSKVLTAEAREDRYAEIMATACVSSSSARSAASTATISCRRPCGACAPPIAGYKRRRPRR